MTTGEQLSSVSSVSNVSALNHLLNITGGGGADRLIPYTELNLNLQIDRMSVNIVRKTILLKIETKTFEAQIVKRDLNIDIEKTELGV